MIRGSGNVVAGKSGNGSMRHFWCLSLSLCCRCANFDFHALIVTDIMAAVPPGVLPVVTAAVAAAQEAAGCFGSVGQLWNQSH
jgi:hypothetical protein